MIPEVTWSSSSACEIEHPQLRAPRAVIVCVTAANPVYLCPDLLRYEQIGAADNLRGRVVRLFFWLMRWWPGEGGRVVDGGAP